jgi:signal transduction histidine kinase
VTLKFDELAIPMLAVGAIASAVRARSARTARDYRASVLEFGWCAALVVLAVSVMATVHSILAWYGLPAWALLVPLGATAVLLAGPRLARRVVPLTLIVTGLFGLLLAGDATLVLAAGHYGLSAIGNPGTEADLILPQAYTLMLLGGWLTWRSEDPVLTRLCAWLGCSRAEPARDQLIRLALVPVILATADLLWPGLLVSGVAGAAWTTAVAGAALVMLRRRPRRAAQLATAVLLGLGLTGLVIAVYWRGGMLSNNNGLLSYGAVLVSTQHTADAAAVQGLALLGLGAWLAPQTFPLVRRMLGLAPAAELARRVQRLTETRAVAVDTASADLRRLERDLHDGAQARLVALGMSLRAAERLIPDNPAAAVALVAEARETSARALTELRELVRGVLPPVLADRGLVDAVRALALDCPLRVETEIDLPGRLPAPIETACYFAVAELLTNAAKHSSAREARITMAHSGGLLRIEVTDFGLGGADPSAGSGLAGVEKRLATFDGILAVSSPAGGPTIVVLEVPCASSSLKTSSC